MNDEFIGNYRILKKIGAGGMAQVYLGVHKDIPNLKVVLKILTDPRLVERFKQEADKLALLDGHGSICQIKHFFNHGDDFVIAMEYIDGVTLDDVINEKGSLPVDESLQIISDVLSTLQFAHEKGIFHRDIKPSNIMIDSRGRVKIIDFGIAKAKSDPNLTIAGSSCGTPSYMPPEQFNPTEDIDYALVDIYAVGTTLYRMLTGKLPFTADNQFALRDAKLFNDPPKPRDLNSTIPKDVEGLILKALAKEPRDRFLSASEMKTSVDSLRGNAKKTDLTEAIPPSLAKTPTPPPTPKPYRKKSAFPKLLAVGLPAIIVVIIAVYWLFLRQTEPTVLLPPTPLSPTIDETVDTSTPTFAWQEPGGQNAKYVVEYAADSAFTSPFVSPTVSNTRYKAEEPLTDGRYFWRVVTTDDQGNRSQPSTAVPFVVSAGEPAAAGGMLSVTVDPRGDIYIDGQSYGTNKSGVDATLDTGRHVLRVVNSESRQKEFRDTIYLAAGETKNAAYTFTFPRPVPRPDSGNVIVGSLPIDGGTIFIDGKLQDLKTNNTFRLPVGVHTIKVVLTVDDRDLEKTDTVRIVKDGTAKKRFDFEE